MGKVIGIDLGTTNSCVAVMEGGEPVVIPNAEGSRTTPSIVAFSKTGERLVGQVAKRQAITNPERTVISIKRDMGTDKKVKIDDKYYTPPEISAMILQKLKADAEEYLGEKITQAVITVPAYFSIPSARLQRMPEGLPGEVLRIINEPTAAALAYGLDRKQTRKYLCLTWEAEPSTCPSWRSATAYLRSLPPAATTASAEMISTSVMDWMADSFRQEYGIDLRNDKMAMQRLKEAAEKAKIELSTVAQTSINLPFITADASGPKHLDMTLTRAKFDEMTADLVEKTMGPTRQALADAGLSPNDIHRVLMVGGSTRIPAVQEAIKKFLGKEPFKGINPDECVAIGAAIQAGVLSGEVKDLLLLDVTPLSLGIETLGGVFTRLIDRNTTIPTKKSQIFSTAADGQTSVDIKVYQGEREIASHNKLLGNFQLTGIPPAPRGVPQIEVTFDIDANGIVHVSAKDLGTGNEQQITITASSNLSEAEIEKAVKEAEKFAAEDKRRKEEVETRNEADSMVYQTERTLKDLGDKLSADDKARIQAEIDKVRKP